MANKNNIIEEIQELIQQFKNEYQEGIDYKSVSGSEIAEWGVEHISILSPRLRQYCREKFNFPFGINDYLDYYKGDEKGAIFYRTGKKPEGEYFWWYDRQKAGHDITKGEKNPKKCAVCNKLAFKKDGRIKLWNGETAYISYGKVWKPSPVAYFHPECSPKYFADKYQPSEKNTQIKEKLLRNLDKLCLDPDGYLANNEYLKTDRAEEEYKRAYNSPYQREWKDRYLKIVIDGEEIDLYEWDNASNEYYEVKRELIKKIKQEIQQNPSEWKIERGKEENYSWDANWLVKHQKSGRQHWKIGLCGMHGKKEYSEEGKNYWAEIETLIKGEPLPVKSQKPTDIELEKLIKIIFQKLDIKAISFSKEGKLVITHNNNNNNKIIDNNQLTSNSEYQTLANYCREYDGKEITKEQLGIGADNSTNNSQPGQNNNHQLAVGLALGTGAVILGGTIVYFIRKRNVRDKS